MGVVLALAALPATAAATVQQFSHGRFEQIPVHMPAGTPQRVVIWFHEPTPGGDTSRLPIEALRADGAMVAAVDIAHLRGVLKREGNPTCSFGSGDVENSRAGCRPPCICPATTCRWSAAMAKAPKWPMRWLRRPIRRCSPAC
jgi:type IV secretory pathway VirJ component